MKKALALVIAAAMALSFVACGGGTSSTPASTPGSTPASGASTPAAAGKVYYLNFKP